MKKSERALETFKSGYNCSQAVFTTFADQNLISDEAAFKISCGFGAGMGRLQQTCGAVTGAFMVIGLKHGKYDKADDELREQTYRKVCEFTSIFEKRNSSIICAELLGVDLKTPEGQKQFKEQNLKQSVCEKCVKEAVEILETIL